MYTLVGSDPNAVLDSEYLTAEDAGFIDYDLPLEIGRGRDVASGDTVVYGFRNQVFVTRAKVGVVDRLADGDPELLELFDRTGNLTDERDRPLGIESTQELMERV